MSRDGDTAPALTGVILAGGEARRLDGADKGLLMLAGRPLIAWAIDALQYQVERLLISANRNLDSYRHYGYPLVSDGPLAGAGPLAGIGAAMEVAPTEHLLVLPVDAPLPPADLGPRLLQRLQAGDAELAVAHDGDRIQFLHALLPCTLRADLGRYLRGGGRRVEQWYAGHRVTLAHFRDRTAFTNVNTEADLQALAARLATRSGNGPLP